jgi:hypothetical protein
MAFLPWWVADLEHPTTYTSEKRQEVCGLPLCGARSKTSPSALSNGATCSQVAASICLKEKCTRARFSSPLVARRAMTTGWQPGWQPAADWQSARSPRPKYFQQVAAGRSTVQPALFLPQLVGFGVERHSRRDPSQPLRENIETKSARSRKRLTTRRPFHPLLRAVRRRQ